MYDVVIIGGGAVGLLLANLCAKQNIHCLVVEKNRSLPPLSLAIGITPPSLSILQSIGLEQEVIAQGLPISEAFVHHGKNTIGGVSFSKIAGEFPFILSIPQNTLVKTLQKRTEKTQKITFRQGWSLKGIENSASSVRITIQSELHPKKEETLTAKYAIACDGAHSKTRSLLNIPFHIKQYSPSFLLSDFSDKTSLGKAAHLFFTAKGSVESFPLANEKRRWIIQKSKNENKPFVNIIQERCGIDLREQDQINHFSFTTQRVVLHTFYQGRVLFAGNAAHVMSPVGGQGLNTGIADAEYISKILPSLLTDPSLASSLLKDFQKFRLKAFHTAANRAALCMRVGTLQGYTLDFLRKSFLKYFILKPPVLHGIPAFFAMQTIPYKNYMEIPRHKQVLQ